MKTGVSAPLLPSPFTKDGAEWVTELGQRSLHALRVRNIGLYYPKNFRFWAEKAAETAKFPSC